jgi:anti-anti-sigma factor
VTLTVRTSGDRSRVTIHGDLDVASAPELNAALHALTTDVVLDLAGAAYVDSTGLAVLVAHRERALARGTTLALVGAQRRLLRAFALAGVGELLAA